MEIRLFMNGVATGLIGQMPLLAFLELAERIRMMISTLSMSRFTMTDHSLKFGQ